MQTNTLFFIIIFLNFSLITYAMEQKCIIHEASGLQYTKNNFGDIFPQWQKIPLENLEHQLSSFVNMLKDEVKGTPFIIEVPHEKATALDSIKKAGFTFYHANNDKSEWIFKNESSIPQPYTAVIGAKVIVKKDDSVLVIEEKTRRKILGFPAGTTEFQELVRTTAVRELKEETNLSANPEDLILIAIINRIKANRFNANFVDYCYCIDHSKTSGNLTFDPSEIIRGFYTPLKDIAEKEYIDGLNVAPAIAAIAQHLLDKNSKSHSKKFLDYRQLRKENPDHNDRMTIEFCAQ